MGSADVVNPSGVRGQIAWASAVNAAATRRRVVDIAAVRNPAAPPGRTLAAYARKQLGWYRELRDELPQDCPLAAWPEPGGVLPFASSIDGDSLGWLTQGEPEN